ncbi:MAG: malate dehydrogenase [Selenomonadaceae bacterium]|nr:malate dehydrogenase [Selenomonadaceae bacterium]
MKVTVIGAGNVGATVANVIVQKNFAGEVVLLDIREGYAEGKAMDMNQASTILGSFTKVTGVTNDYAATANSKVVVVTSGIPRKPGMTREELIDTNAAIVKDVVGKAREYSPDAIFIIISNPMDTMTYLTMKATGLPRNKVLGLGGMLDSARFKYYITKALQAEGIDASLTDVEGMVIGGHNDKTMVPLIKYASYRGIPVTNIINWEAILDAARETKKGGATLTQLIGTSAWYAPGAAVATLVEAIVTDAKKLIPCCVYLDGEYGHKDVCIGVPVVLGENGAEKIVDINLDGPEFKYFNASVEAARETNALLANALKEVNEAEEPEKKEKSKKK